MKRLLPKLAIFALGVITGAACTSVFIGYRVDTLYMENRVLEQRLAAVDRELQQLEEKRQTTRRLVTKISTRVSFSEECEFTDYEKSSLEMAVEKNVREWLKLVLGQDLDTVNYQLVPRIVDNRELDVEGNKIRLKVNLVVISDNLTVYVEVLPVREVM